MSVTTGSPSRAISGMAEVPCPPSHTGGTINRDHGLWQAVRLHISFDFEAKHVITASIGVEGI